MSILFRAPRRSSMLSPIFLFTTAFVLIFALVLQAGAGSFQVTGASARSPLSLSTASAVPDDVQAYLVIEADLDSDQMQRAVELLERAGLGSAEDLVSSSIETVVGPDSELTGDLQEMRLVEVAISVRNVDLATLGEEENADPSEGLFGRVAQVAGGQADTSDEGFDEGGGTVDNLLESAGIDSDQLDIPEGFALIVDAGSAESVDSLLNEFRESEVASGATIEERDIDGSQIVVSTLGGNVQGTVVVLGQILVFTASVDDAIAYVQTYNGVLPALPERSEFQSVATALPSEVMAFGFAKSPEDFSMFEQVIQEMGVGFSLSLLIEPGLASGFALSATDEGFRIDTAQVQSEMMEDAAATTASDLSFAERIPEGTILAVNGMDLGDSLVIRLIEQLLVVGLSSIASDDVGPPPEITEAYLEEQFAGLSVLLGFNAQTEFLRQLAGEYGFALTEIDLVNPAAISAILISELDDAEVVGDSMRSLGVLIQAAAQGQARVTTASFGDALLSQIVVPVEGQEITVQYGVLDGEFVLGLGNAVPDYALGTGPYLSTDPAYVEVISLLPEDHDGVFYIGTERLVSIVETIVMGFSGDVDFGITDDSEACQQFEGQAAAQAAYDEDPVGNFDLDIDFDGIACEDAFETTTSDLSSTNGLNVSIGSFGLVSYSEDGLSRTTGILVIPGTDE